MASHEGPTEAILKLLSEELRAVIVGLPTYLQDSVPERVKVETGIIAAHETAKDKKPAPNQ
jgi:hypothetical protein